MTWLDKIREQGKRARRGVRVIDEDMVCKTPGMRIRSKGRGRGLARGRGRGPFGIPYWDK